ncbi:MAG: TIGR02300 family protein, partial [Pseudomonadota bacterium]
MCRLTGSARCGTAPLFPEHLRELSMPKPEWGVKRTCLTCAARFYDMMRDPIICPSCGAEFDATVATTKPRRSKAPAKAAAAAAAPLVEVEDDTDEEEDSDKSDSDDDEEEATVVEEDLEMGSRGDEDDDVGDDSDDEDVE